MSMKRFLIATITGVAKGVKAACVETEISHLKYTDISLFYYRFGKHENFCQNLINVLKYVQYPNITRKENRCYEMNELIVLSIEQIRDMCMKTALWRIHKFWWSI
jgi:hypothetical protein